MTAGGRQRILVVDDNEAGRYAVGRVLRQAGFELSEAGTGGEALQRVAEEHPDLVLLDVRLPDINGVEVCHRIKSSPETSSTLVLQTSASAADSGVRVTALERGADGYLPSPVEPSLVVATVRSLLRIRTAEQALQHAAVEWQSTFDAIRDGVAVLDARGIVQRSNAALPGLLGRERREIEGRSLDELIPPSPGDPFLVGGLDSLCRTNVERVMGQRRPSASPSIRSRMPAKNLRGCVAIVTDVTERKRMDHQLWHSQKLESIGLLAGGVAHDFNNLLMGILGNASLALDSLDDARKARRLLQDVTRASERAAELTRQLLAYAGKGRFVAEPVDLSRLIHELVPLIQTSIPRKVRLTLDLSPDQPPIQADKTQIEQLVMNLIINGGEAIQGEAGSVTVSTTMRHVTAEELGAYLTENKTEGNYLVLQVPDTGCGMDEETRRRIFDPFYSTKFLGRGLGLSAALGIVRGHKGALKVTSAPGRGTLFEVLFPASAKARVRPRPRPEAAPARGRGTILVVDDERIVRDLLHAVLTRTGYEVLLAENGAEAINLFSRNADRISLVLLDLVMPVMSGEEALPHLLNMKAGVPVIVSSGQDEEECMRKLRDPRLAGFLQKPYKPASLVAKVHAVLGVTASADAGGAKIP